MPDNIKYKVFSGLFWKFTERIGIQGIQFVISIVLARLLAPSDFGIIGLITVFIAIAGIFVSSGFGQSLIQKKEVDDIDYSSVFYMSLVISIFMYIGLYFLAPLISVFYEESILIPIIRVLSLTLILGAINSIQNAVLTKNMMFKKTFIVNLGGIITSGIVGIAIAYLGYGVWALVISQLASQVVTTIIMWFTVKWRPKLLFSLERLRSLFNFGSKLLVSGLLDTIYNNLYSLIIGKLYSRELLGYYNRGQSMPNLFASTINGTIGGVMFPALVLHQNDINRLKTLVKRMIVTSTFFVFPMMVGLAAVAKPLVLILLTDKWLPCVPYLQISCITFAFYPIHTSNLQAVNAIGRSDVFLKLEIVKKIIGITAIFVTAPFGVMAMVIGLAVISVICTAINALPNKKLLNYSYKEQMMDILPSILLSTVMGGILLVVFLFRFNSVITLVIQALVGIVFYFTAAYILKFECFRYLIKMIRKGKGTLKQSHQIA